MVLLGVVLLGVVLLAVELTAPLVALDVRLEIPLMLVAPVGVPSEALTWFALFTVATPV